MAVNHAVVEGAHDPGAVVRHVPELDGVRGIAVLMVGVIHLWPAGPGYEWLTRVIGYGWAGVDLFFVLSGYLITTILWRTRDAPRYYRSFYGRRMLRIAPPLLLFFGVVIVLSSAFGGLPAPLGSLHELPAELPLHAFLYLLLMGNVAHVIFGGIWAPLSLTWSLAVEEHFYLAWPLVVRRVRRHARRLVLGLLAVIAVSPLLRWAGLRLLHLDHYESYILTPLHLDGLAMGAVLALVLAEEMVPAAWIRRAAVWVLAFGGPMLLVGAALDLHVPGFDPDRRHYVIYSLTSLLGACIVTLAILPGAVARRVLGFAPLRAAGRVSYGAYLYHWTVAVVMNRALDAVGYPLPRPDGATLSESVAYVTLGLAATFAVSGLSWRLLERPVLAFRGRFDPWREWRAPAAPKGFGASVGGLGWWRIRWR